MYDSVTPWTAACQASLSITNSRSLLKLMSIESVIPSNHHILCHPLLLLPSSSYPLVTIDVFFLCLWVFLFYKFFCTFFLDFVCKWYHDICPSLTSLSMIISRSIHIAANGTISFFLWLSYYSAIIFHWILWPSPRKRNVKRQNGYLRRSYKQLRKEDKLKAKEKRKDTPIWIQSSKEYQGKTRKSSSVIIAKK